MHAAGSEFSLNFLYQMVALEVRDDPHGRICKIPLAWAAPSMISTKKKGRLSTEHPLGPLGFLRMVCVRF